jgi:CHASE3 domain sensor protein
MDQEILEKLSQQEAKLEQVYKSVERMRKYFLWSVIITVMTIVLPILGLIVIIPWFLKIITSAYGL